MKKAVFEFYAHISPRYVEPLFVRLEPGRWYDFEDLTAILQENGAELKSTHVIRYNIAAWTLAGLGRTKNEYINGSRRVYIQLTSLGKEMIETYSTNKELFFDLMHFVFYSAWYRSRDMSRSRFWVYASACDALWYDAPAQMDSYRLANRLHIDAREQFSEYEPALPERGVRSIFPWLTALSPPFLEKCGTKNQLCSKRRSYCTPQLFHAAVDLVYTQHQFNYGTSMSLNDSHIHEICKIALLDPQKFWDMAGLTEMVIREFSTQRNQWGRSIVLAKSPTWINLPDFSDEIDGNDNDEEEAGDEKKEDEDAPWT